jgi:hypothetical protein
MDLSDKIRITGISTCSNKNRMRLLLFDVINLGEVSTFDGVLLLLPHQLPDTSTLVKARTETGLCAYTATL